MKTKKQVKKKNFFLTDNFLGQDLMQEGFWKRFRMHNKGNEDKVEIVGSTSKDRVHFCGSSFDDCVEKARIDLSFRRPL